jgi:hypothetical protein
MLKRATLLLVFQWVCFGRDVNAQDAGICRATCEADKQQCRTGLAKADPASLATTAGVIALGLSLPQAYTRPVTPVGNPRDEVEARLRADQESKLARQERDGQCNSSFMQCLGTCLPDETKVQP